LVAVDKLKSASQWDLGIVYALNIFFHPLEDFDKVLPADKEPSDQDTVLFDGAIDEEVFNNPAKWRSVSQRDPLLQSFISNLNLLHTINADFKGQNWGVMWILLQRWVR